jgi:hypothetical protein
MPKTKNLEELGQWKVGQKVYIDKTSSFHGYEAVSPIERITDGRGGSIYVKDMNFDKNGKERGEGYHKATIRPATEEDIIRIRGNNARSRIKHYDWSELDPAKAIEIEKLLNENGIQTKG